MSDIAFEWRQMQREVYAMSYRIEPARRVSSRYRNFVGFLTLVAILMIIAGFIGSLLFVAYWASGCW